MVLMPTSRLPRAAGWQRLEMTKWWTQLPLICAWQRAGDGRALPAGPGQRGQVEPRIGMRPRPRGRRRRRCVVGPLHTPDPVDGLCGRSVKPARTGTDALQRGVVWKGWRPRRGDREWQRPRRAGTVLTSPRRRLRLFQAGVPDAMSGRWPPGVLKCRRGTYFGWLTTQSGRMGLAAGRAAVRYGARRPRASTR